MLKALSLSAILAEGNLINKIKERKKEDKYMKKMTNEEACQRITEMIIYFTDFVKNAEESVVDTEMIRGDIEALKIAKNALRKEMADE